MIHLNYSSCEEHSQQHVPHRCFQDLRYIRQGAQIRAGPNEEASRLRPHELGERSKSHQRSYN